MLTLETAIRIIDGAFALMAISDHDLDAVARAQGQRGGKTLFRADRRPFLNALIPRIGGLDRVCRSA